MTRTAFALVLLLAAAPARAAADDPKPPDYYPLAKGHKWEYAAEFNDTKVDITAAATAVKTEKGKTTAALTVTADGKDDESEVVVSADGISGRFLLNLPITRSARLLKYPVKARDTWTEKFTINDKDLVVTTRVKDAEEVKVPAGTFRAVPVETGILTDNGETIGITTWYADGVGPVRFKLVYGANEANMKLKKFTPGK